MTRRSVIVMALLLAVMAPAGGCKREGESFDLQKYIASKTGPPEELNWLDDPDPDKRRQAIEVLSAKRQYQQEPHTKFYALKLSKDSDATVRAAAARALGLCGDGTYVPQLIAALEDTSPVVRSDAAWALDRVPDDSAIAPLTKHAMQDTVADVRAACCWALRHYALSPVGQTLLRALGDADLNVRRRARQSLAELTGVDLGDKAEDWRQYLELKTQDGR